jgi:hypothetical protein
MSFLFIRFMFFFVGLCTQVELISSSRKSVAEVFYLFYNKDPEDVVNAVEKFRALHNL